MTDGGRETERPSRPSPAFDTPDREDDPFVWAGGGATSSEPSSGTQSSSGASDPFVWAGDQLTNADGSADGPDGDGEMDYTKLSLTREESPAGSSHVENGNEDGRETPPVEDLDDLGDLEDRVERLEDLAENLNIAALNASLKHARDDDEDLESVHDELETYAEQLDSEIDRLADAIEYLNESESRSLAGPARDLVPLRGPERPRRADRSVLPGEAGGRNLDGIDDGDRAVGTVSTEANGSSKNGHETEVVPSGDPFEFLIPGAELRDMWRAGGMARGDRPEAERWVLETTPRSVDDESREFPPEVTEFALDPDEVSFADLLEDVVDDG